MLKITREYVTDSLGPGNPPVAACKSGDTVIFETRDCYNDCLMPDGTMLDSWASLTNPSTGPLLIKEAMPGDVLKVEILCIELKDTALMRVSPTNGAFQHNLKERRVKEYRLEDGKVRFNDQLTLDLEPMIGVIGTAPKDMHVHNSTPKEHGGNMDCKKITAGSVLYLPVSIPGGMLSMGDLHALMGDGEVLICGLETAGEVTVRVTVVRDFSMPTPCLLQKNRFMTIQSANTLDEAAILASRKMQEFLVLHTPMDEYDVGRLLSLKGDLAICQIVDPLMTVRMEIDEKILLDCGVALP